MISDSTPADNAAATFCPRTLLERCSEWIVEVATAVGSRQRLPPEDVEDFVSWVVLRMMARDHALLRACRAPDRPWPYLRAVIHNLLKDYRNHIWGKWRPSAGARRHGPVAVHLERLIHRDGLSVREAIEMLRRNFGCLMNTQELHLLAACLPRWPRRQMVPLDPDLLSGDERTDRRLRNRELRTKRAATRQVLGAALAQLDDEELAILRLHYREGRTLARIARELRIDQRSIYTKRDSCLQRIRETFRLEGLRWADVAPCLGWEGDENTEDLLQACFQSCQPESSSESQSESSILPRHNKSCDGDGRRSPDLENQRGVSI